MTGNLAEVIHPDLGKQRGISAQVCALFHVHANGTGWLWETKTREGQSAERWKSYYSTREEAPEGERQCWAKYRWHPERPAGADYLCPPGASLTNAVKLSDGVLWLAGGEVAAMSMMSAGLLNTTCFFGDTNIPDTLADDLKAWGVTTLNMIPDRDEAGQQCAFNVRKLLKDSGITLNVYALPYPLSPKHGKDVNDYWQACDYDPAAFKTLIVALDRWALPEQVEEPIRVYPDLHSILDTDLPADFIRDIERALEVYPVFNADGWSKRNIRCPFHEDEHASANWNHNKAILKCFGCNPVGRTHYLAKDVGERFGLDLHSYTRVPMVKAPDLRILPKPEPDAPRPEVRYELPKLRPALPKEADLTPDQIATAAEGRRWLDDYANWAKVGTLYVPDSFHEACALWLLATVATRRMRFNNGIDIYPNLYLMIVAPTTRFHKSTAFRQLNRLVQKANIEPLLLPIDATPEALFDELAGVKPINFEKLSEEDRQQWLIGRTVAAQRSILKDEASSILAAMRKDYNAGLVELLLQGYDGDTGKQKKLLKSKGLTMIKDPCLSFLGATTPIMWGKYIGTEEHENGFAARFAIITPDGAPDYRQPSYSALIPEPLVGALRRMYIDLLPWHDGRKPSAPQLLGDLITPPVMNVMASPEAQRQLNAYLKAMVFDLVEDLDDAKAAAYGRLGTMAYKVAMLLAAIHTDSGTVRIEEPHAYAAQIICERWRESLYRLERDIAKANGSLEDKVLAYLRTAGEPGASLRDIMRDCAIKDKQRAVNTLEIIAEEGVIEKYDLKHDGPGRPSIRYRLTPK